MPVYGRTFGRLAVEAARRTGSFASGRSYIQKYFPPGYREPAIKVVKAFEQAATGAGLYQIIQTFISDDTPGNSAPFQQTQTNKQNKTRIRRTERSGRRKSTKFYSNKGCRCPRPSKYNRSRYRKYR